MPGFWEQLQQYAQQDQMRKQHISARELELAKMLGGFAESDSANAINYAQMQNQSLTSRGGLLQAIAQMQQTERNSGNSIVAGERQIASSERNNDKNNATSLKTAQINANTDSLRQENENVRWLLENGYTFKTKNPVQPKPKQYIGGVIPAGEKENAAMFLAKQLNLIY